MFHVNVVNLINVWICVFILFWMNLKRKFYFNSIFTYIFNILTDVVNFFIIFSMQIVIVISNSFAFLIKWINLYFVDAKCASCFRIQIAQMFRIFFNVLQLIVVKMLYINTLTSSTKFNDKIMNYEFSKFLINQRYKKNEQNRKILYMFDVWFFWTKIFCFQKNFSFNWRFRLKRVVCTNYT